MSLVGISTVSLLARDNISTIHHQAYTILQQVADGSHIKVTKNNVDGCIAVMDAYSAYKDEMMEAIELSRLKQFNRRYVKPYKSGLTTVSELKNIEHDINGISQQITADFRAMSSAMREYQARESNKERELEEAHQIMNFQQRMDVLYPETVGVKADDYEE